MNGNTKILNGLRKLLLAGLAGALAATPTLALSRSVASGPLFAVRATQDPDHFVEPQNEQDRRDAQQEARDREQEKREQEQERKDQEQEKKDQEQERLDQMQEMYDQGREALEHKEFDEALSTFDKLSRMNGPQTDAALYWKAYAENQSGKREASLTAIADLKKRFPQSRWKKDAEALEIEVRNSSGHPVKPDEVEKDDDLFTLAFQGLMNNNPTLGIQKAEQILSGSASPKRKSNVLFAVAQNGSKEAQELLGKIASGQSNPEVQRKAVEYLGMFGGDRAANALATIYANTTDAGVKRAVIQSYMMSGNREQLFKLAQAEKHEELKRDAIQKLGLTGGLNELQQLYKTETTTEGKREILQAFFLGGDSQKMVQAAESEKDPELRRTAIRNLGLMGKSDVLQSIYSKESDRSLKEEVLNSYFISGNAHALVAVAKSEKDPELKKRAVEKLSLMNSKEGSEFLMELLNK
jgi:HEAT repeat protein